MIFIINYQSMPEYEETMEEQHKKNIQTFCECKVFKALMISSDNEDLKTFKLNKILSIHIYSNFLIIFFYIKKILNISLICYFRKYVV